MKKIIFTFLILGFVNLFGMFNAMAEDGALDQIIKNQQRIKEIQAELAEAKHQVGLAKEIQENKCKGTPNSPECAFATEMANYAALKEANTTDQAALAQAQDKADKACKKDQSSATCKVAEKELLAANKKACESGNARIKGLEKQEKAIIGELERINSSGNTARIDRISKATENNKVKAAAIQAETVKVCEAAQAGTSTDIYKVRIFEPIGVAESGKYSKGNGKEGTYEYQELEASNGVELINLYIREIYAWMAGIIGIVCVLMIVVSGCQIIFGGASPELVSDAKTRIIQSLLSLILLFATALLLRTINPGFFGFQGPKTAPKASTTQSAPTDPATEKPPVTTSREFEVLPGDQID